MFGCWLSCGGGTVIMGGGRMPSCIIGGSWRIPADGSIDGGIIPAQKQIQYFNAQFLTRGWAENYLAEEAFVAGQMCLAEVLRSGWAAVQRTDSGRSFRLWMRRLWRQSSAAPAPPSISGSRISRCLCASGRRSASSAHSASRALNMCRSNHNSISAFSSGENNNKNKKPNRFVWSDLTSLSRCENRRDGLWSFSGGNLMVFMPMMAGSHCRTYGNNSI